MNAGRACVVVGIYSATVRDSNWTRPLLYIFGQAFDNSIQRLAIIPSTGIPLCCSKKRGGASTQVVGPAGGPKTG